MRQPRMRTAGVNSRQIHAIWAEAPAAEAVSAIQGTQHQFAQARRIAFTLLRAGNDPAGDDFRDWIVAVSQAEPGRASSKRLRHGAIA